MWYDNFMANKELRESVRNLRASGMTYAEILKELKIDIPKATMSGWCNSVKMPKEYPEKLKALNKSNLFMGRKISLRNRARLRDEFYTKLEIKNKGLLSFFASNLKVRKITLAVLYLAEGSKSARGSLMFGNSDPQIIKMFVNLLRECYKIDESKFRCTVQCRADQNISKLEDFWVDVTMIPREQFYNARVDKRTVGIPSKKPDYNGVCRIDYFSSAIDLELKHIAQMAKMIF